MEWVESTGASIEEAKEQALDRLGVHDDDAEFEIIADVKLGLFGRVKEEARVRARVAPTTPRAKDDRRRGRGRGGKSGGGRGAPRGQGQGGGGSDRKGGGRKPERSNAGRSSGGRDGKGRASEGGNGKNGNRKRQSEKSDNRTAGSRGEEREKTMTDDEVTRAESTMPLPEQADLAEEFVRGLAERFGTSVDFTREDIDEDEIRITVNGDDLGRMIGRRGTTAGAIDELVRTVLQRQAGSSRNGRIRVDVGGVRARRAEALANFSKAQAEEVRSSGEARSLEPMSAADRKVVHDALSDEDGVDTISEGEDSRRRVVIIPVGAGD